MSTDTCIAYRSLQGVVVEKTRRINSSLWDGGSSSSISMYAERKYNFYKRGNSSSIYNALLLVQLLLLLLLLLLIFCGRRLRNKLSGPCSYLETHTGIEGSIFYPLIGQGIILPSRRP